MVAAGVGSDSGHGWRQGRRSEEPGLPHDSEWLEMLLTGALVAQGYGCKDSLKAGEGKMNYVKS